MTGGPAICADCGYIGTSRKREKGSRTVERLLWWVFLIPGPFYSLWRAMGRKIVCAECGGENLVPFETDEGQKIFERNLAAQETNTRAR